MRNRQLGPDDDALAALINATLEAGHAPNWGELHYCINDFCDLFGIEYGNGVWDEHTDIRTAILKALVPFARRHGWPEDA
jgi:hypothetical protein